MGMAKDKWLRSGPTFSSHLRLARINPGSERGPKRLIISYEVVDGSSESLGELDSPSLFSPSSIPTSLPDGLALVIFTFVHSNVSPRRTSLQVYLLDLFFLDATRRRRISRWSSTLTLAFPLFDTSSSGLLHLRTEGWEYNFASKTGSLLEACQITLHRERLSRLTLSPQFIKEICMIGQNRFNPRMCQRRKAIVSRLKANS